MAGLALVTATWMMHTEENLSRINVEWFTQAPWVPQAKRGPAAESQGSELGTVYAWRIWHHLTADYLTFVKWFNSCKRSKNFILDLRWQYPHYTAQRGFKSIHTQSTSMHTQIHPGVPIKDPTPLHPSGGKGWASRSKAISWGPDLSSWAGAHDSDFPFFSGKEILSLHDLFQ